MDLMKYKTMFSLNMENNIFKQAWEDDCIYLALCIKKKFGRPGKQEGKDMVKK